MNRTLLAVASAAALIAASIAAYGGNTTFLTDRSGQITFPISPPNRANTTPGAIDNMTIGATTPAAGIFTNITNNNPTPIVQGAPSSQDTAATLTAAQLSANILTSGPASAINLQLPLATAMDTAFPNSVAGSAFDFTIANTSTTAANTDTVTTNTGWTLVGNMVVPGLTAGPGTSGRFRARKTGTGAWTLYRIS